MKRIAIWLAIIALLSGVPFSGGFAAPSRAPGGILIRVKPPRVARIAGHPLLVSPSPIAHPPGDAKPIPAPKKINKSSRDAKRLLLRTAGALAVGCASGSSQPAPIVALASALK